MDGCCCCYVCDGCVVCGLIVLGSPVFWFFSEDPVCLNGRRSGGMMVVFIDFLEAVGKGSPERRMQGDGVP